VRFCVVGVHLADAGRELKTQYELGEFDTTKELVVRILLYVALLSLPVSHDLFELLTEHAHVDIVCPPKCRAATLGSPGQFSSIGLASASATGAVFAQTSNL